MKKYISPETLNIMVTAGGLLMGSQDSKQVMERPAVSPGQVQFNI